MIPANAFIDHAFQSRVATSLLENCQSSKIFFFDSVLYSALKKVENVENCIVTRCGYTGEDGFEISIPNQEAIRLTKVLLGEKSVLPVGIFMFVSIFGEYFQIFKFPNCLFSFGSNVDGEKVSVRGTRFV
jgi:hypothetical protein